MTAAIVLSLLAQGAPIPAPRLPVGSTAAFAQAALAVDARLAAGDVAGAREATRALPVRNPKLAWTDDSALPPALRAARADRLAKVSEAWASQAKGFAPRVSADAPDLTIGFAAALPNGADGLPAPIRIEPGIPLRATIGVARGKSGAPIAIPDMGMEIAYVLGRYLGVSDTPFGPTAMNPTLTPELGAYMPQSGDLVIAAQNLDLADRLRAAVEVGKPIGLTAPSLNLPLATIDLGEVQQGARLHGALRIENKGSGTLNYVLKPDCSCFLLPQNVPVPALGGKTLNFEIDTFSYVGRIDKLLLLMTNDPQQPTVEIPVTFRSTPAYRLFHPGGDRVVVPETGGTYDIFLLVPPGSDIRPTDAHWEGGADAKLTWAEWEGPLADPDMQEGPLFRKGWRFRVRIPATLPIGHLTPGTLTVATESPRFGTLTASLVAQRGIAADPESLYMGLLKPGAQVSFLVRRPKTPFKILGVDAGLLKAVWRDVGGGTDYRIDLTYVGGAQKGDLAIPVRVRTDDPKHPLVEALVSGNVP